jgi:Ca-activated chloride channel family protein
MKRLRQSVAMRAAILLALAFVSISTGISLSFAQQTQETTAPSSRRAANSVMLTVTVTDRHRNYVKGLGQTNFTVSDGKQEQQINAFSDSDTPLSVGILLDTSMSVGKEGLKSTRDALKQFFQLSDQRNEYFLVGFGTKPKLLQDWTSDTGRLLNRIGNAQNDGATALYDACSLAVEKVLTGQHQKHVLIVISDGLDTISNTNLAGLKHSLEESGVLLYAVSAQGIGSPGGRLVPQGRDVLEDLSATTGGDGFYLESAKQSNTVFEIIAIELRNQYLIGFTPTAVDGKRRSLKVAVTLPADAPREMQSLIVRSRKSFYARASQQP